MGGGSRTWGYILGFVKDSRLENSAAGYTPPWQGGGEDIRGEEDSRESAGRRSCQ